MKTSLFSLALTLAVSAGAWAQHHVGTWRIASATYTNAQMKRESVDQSKHHELKIITPTHFMWITYEPGKTSPGKEVFGGAGGGRYTLDGIKYVEMLEYASWAGYESNITDFSLRVEGDKMYQMGALSNQEGEKTIIEEEWQREATPPQDGKLVGTWHLQSQQITGADGKSGPANGDRSHQGKNHYSDPLDVHCREQTERQAGVREGRWRHLHPHRGPLPGEERVRSRRGGRLHLAPGR
jgi:hypothetical protein